MRESYDTSLRNQFHGANGAVFYFVKKFLNFGKQHFEAAWTKCAQTMYEKQNTRSTHSDNTPNTNRQVEYHHKGRSTQNQQHCSNIGNEADLLAQFSSSCLFHCQQYCRYILQILVKFKLSGNQKFHNIKLTKYAFGTKCLFINIK